MEWKLVYIEGVLGEIFGTLERPQLKYWSIIEDIVPSWLNCKHGQLISR